jgi:hypothetical protein
MRSRFIAYHINKTTKFDESGLLFVLKYNLNYRSNMWNTTRYNVHMSGGDININNISTEFAGLCCIFELRLLESLLHIHVLTNVNAMYIE